MRGEGSVHAAQDSGTVETIYLNHSHRIVAGYKYDERRSSYVIDALPRHASPAAASSAAFGSAKRPNCRRFLPGSPGSHPERPAGSLSIWRMAQSYAMSCPEATISTVLLPPTNCLRRSAH